LQVTRENLLATHVARQAFEKLTRKVDETELFKLLQAIPHASAKRLSLVEGMNDRSLRLLSDRIRKWADTIERVNASHFLRLKTLPSLVGKTGNTSLPQPLNLVCSDSEWAKRTSENFGRLPGILRFYADFLRAWIKFLIRPKDFVGSGFLSHWSLRGFRPRTIGVLALMKLVRDSVGRPCRSEIVTLLDAAYKAAGLPTPKMITEDGLQKLEENNPTVWWTLHPEVWA
jgi:hypothetical protein